MIETYKIIFFFSKGDPSGVAAGFNFMRVTEKSNRSSGKSGNKVEITGEAYKKANPVLHRLSFKYSSHIFRIS